jgi:uncharacterized membrane protein
MIAAFFILIFLMALVGLLVRVARLSAQLSLLQSRLSKLEQAKSAPQGEPPPTPLVTPATPVPSAPPAPPPAQAEQPVRPAAVAPPPPPRPSRTKEEWEALIGGKLLNRVGALALIIGVGFFLKYAFENNWITETFRVLIGAVIGACALIVATRAEKKGFAVFAQGLVGAGLAILYLSVYASFNFYHLLPQLPAFLLMAVVTILAFTQAFRYDSLAVSLLGWLGGFLTPFLLSTGENNQIGLFTYLFLLDAGVILVLQRKQAWSVLEPLTIAGTSILYFSWFAEYYDSTFLVSTVIFAGLFWLLFHGLDLFLIFRSTEQNHSRRRMLGWMNCVLAFFALSFPPFRSDEKALTAVLVAFALLYTLSALAVLRWKRAEQSSAVHFFLAATIILAMALLNEFERFAIPIAWALESVAVVILARRLQSHLLGLTGEVLLVMAFLTLLVTRGAILYDPVTLYSPILNGRFLAFALLLAATAGVAMLLKQMGRPAGSEIFHYGWILILLLIVSVEINDIFRALAVDAPEIVADAAGFQRTLTFAGAWIVLGLAFLALAGRILLRPFLLSGSFLVLIALVLAGMRGIAFVPKELFVPIVNVRFAALLFVGAGGLLAASLLKPLRDKNSWAGEFRLALQIVVAVLGALLITGEIRDTFERTIMKTLQEYSGSDELDRLENLKQLSLSGGWLLYSIILMGIGLWQRNRAVRILAIALFGCTILKIFIYDLSFLETLYRFVSFLALGVILLTVSYLYQRYRSIIFGPSRE